MMLTPCWPSAGPTGGAGVAAPAWICSLMTPAIFLFGGIVPSSPSSVVCAGPLIPRRGRCRLQLLDLAERQLDRCLPAEDLDKTPDLLRVRVDLGDRGV